MKNKPSDYYLRNISRRWKIEIRKAEGKVIIISPYLTSKTAELVIDNSDDKQYEIYTVFSVQNFASGASSLKTLKILHERGCKLYHLPRLHAKMVIIPGAFVSIGSQNLTKNGTKNKEASIAIFNPKEVAKVEKRLDKWLLHRQDITERMIQALEDRLLALKRKYSLLKSEANKLEKEIWVEEAKRIEKARLAQKAEAERLEKQILEKKLVEEKEIIKRQKEEKRKQRINIFRTKISQLSEHGEIEFSLAQEFIRKSAYWDHPKAGLISAPGHANRISGNEKDWRIKFGANTFLVSHAIWRCQESLLKFVDDVEFRKIKSFDNRIRELREELENNVIGAVANFQGDEYQGYYSGVNGDYMIFGTQAINFKDFVDFFIRKVQFDSFISNWSSL